jgi:hypothetical protein
MRGELADNSLVFGVENLVNKRRFNVYNFVHNFFISWITIVTWFIHRWENSSPTLLH